MVEHAQQPGIAEGHSGLATQLHVIHAGGQVGTADESQPLLHLVAFIDEFCVLAAAFSLKKEVQIKFPNSLLRHSGATPPASGR